MSKSLPELSRFELQCLRRLWNKGEASVREIQAEFPTGPSYSTFRKIIERLEDKGAVVRVRQEGRAWIYRSAVSPSGMIRKEIRRLIDGLFDGKGAPLVAHLADMEALSLEDLREIEETLAAEDTGKGVESKPSAPPAPRKRRR
jgi:BlaI family transcriptional regulator, penicillinase repressor